MANNCRQLLTNTGDAHDKCGNVDMFRLRVAASHSPIQIVVQVQVLASVLFSWKSQSFHWTYVRIRLSVQQRGTDRNFRPFGDLGCRAFQNISNILPPNRLARLVELKILVIPPAGKLSFGVRGTVGPRLAPPVATAAARRKEGRPNPASPIQPCAQYLHTRSRR